MDAGGRWFSHDEVNERGLRTQHSHPQILHRSCTLPEIASSRMQAFFLILYYFPCRCRCVSKVLPSMLPVCLRHKTGALRNMRTIQNVVGPKAKAPMKPLRMVSHSIRTAASRPRNAKCRALCLMKQV